MSHLERHIGPRRASHLVLTSSVSTKQEEKEKTSQSSWLKGSAFWVNKRE